MSGVARGSAIVGGAQGRSFQSKRLMSGIFDHIRLSEGNILLDGHAWLKKKIALIDPPSRSPIAEEDPSANPTSLNLIADKHLLSDWL